MTKKAGFVAIIGKPNSGKSTLLNNIIGEDVSIVTPKPQTTRNKILGIYTKENVQIVFADTPGILKPVYKLQDFMKRETESSFLETDIILLIIDSFKFEPDEVKRVTLKYSKEFRTHKVFCVINKIDLLTKEEVLHIIDEVSKQFKFDEIIPVSAKKKFNLDELLNVIINYLPESEFYFDDGIIATQPEKFFVSELIRKQVLKQYNEEVPFAVFVDIEEFKERGKGKDYIRANIILEKDSQKRILIGSGGSMIKQLGEKSREEIEEFLGKQIFLELFVKVRKNWKNDDAFLRKNFSRSTIAGN